MSETTTALVPVQKPLFSYAEAKDFALVAAQSNMFLSLGITKNDSNKALAIIMMGREMGLGLAASLRNIWIGENGIPNLYSRAMASLIKGSGEYDYETLEWTDKKAEIRFIKYDKVARAWKPLSPTSTFTVEDATKAGLTTKKGNAWEKFRKNMLWARALTNGFSIHCPHLANGLPVYGVAEEERYSGAENASSSPPINVDGSEVQAAEFEVRKPIPADPEAGFTVTDEEYQKLVDMATAKKSSLEAIKQHLQLDTLRAITAPQYKKIMSVLEAR